MKKPILQRADKLVRTLVEKRGVVSAADLKHLASVCDRAAFQLRRLAVEHPEGLSAETLEHGDAPPPSTDAPPLAEMPPPRPPNLPEPPRPPRKAPAEASRTMVSRGVVRQRRKVHTPAEPAPTQHLDGARPGGGAARAPKSPEEVLAMRPLRPPPRRAEPT